MFILFLVLYDYKIVVVVLISDIFRFKLNGWVRFICKLEIYFDFMGWDYVFSFEMIVIVKRFWCTNWFWFSWRVLFLEFGVVFYKDYRLYGLKIRGVYI